MVVWHIRALFVVTLFLSLALPAMTQPGADETWLHVVARTPDGTPMAAAPTVRLMRYVGRSRIPVAGPTDVTPAQEVIIGGLAPGRYEVAASLPALGLADTPAILDLLPGHTTHTWTLPDAAAVTLAMPAAQGTPTVYLKRGDATSASIVGARLEGEVLHIGGLVAGSYEMLVLADAGYGFTAFTVKGAGRVDIPELALLPYGAVRLATTINGQPGQGNALYMRMTLRPGFHLVLHGNAEPDGSLLLARVPPGTWATDVKSPIGHRRGSIAVAAGETAAISADFVRPPLPAKPPAL